MKHLQAESGAPESAPLADALRASEAAFAQDPTARQVEDGYGGRVLEIRDDLRQFYVADGVLRPVLETVGYVFEGNVAYRPSPERFVNATRANSVAVVIAPQATIPSGVYNSIAGMHGIDLDEPGYQRHGAQPIGVGRLGNFFHDSGLIHILTPTIGGHPLMDLIAWSFPAEEGDVKAATGFTNYHDTISGTLNNLLFSMCTGKNRDNDTVVDSSQIQESITSHAVWLASRRGVEPQELAVELKRIIVAGFDRLGVEPVVTWPDSTNEPSGRASQAA